MGSCNQILSKNMPIIFEISDLDKALLEKAKIFLTDRNVYIYDEKKNILFKNKSVSLKPNDIIKFWVIFSVGIEMLLKSLLIKYYCLIFTKKNLTGRMNALNKSAPNYGHAANAYNYMLGCQINAKDSIFKNQLSKQQISLMYELNLGTLGDCQNWICALKNKKILNKEEYADIYNSIQVLMDVRRNFDAHNVGFLNVAGSINGDLDELYLPTINILFQKLV
ncbi:MAG: hypothetical protein KKA19_05180 [Candidatus Margulisbacteria bacterium]|nr:hypothetical protein [Candidatus Margulisiibacteriota bacterium]